MNNVLIVGGGAAGMASAIMLKKRRPDIDVTIVEKNREVGRKLRATGNGACNISNQKAPGLEESMEFFDNVGISVKADENGWYYPYSREASAVVNLMEERLNKLNVKILTDTAVLGIDLYPNQVDDKFDVHVEGDNIRCDAVVIAAGGKAAPQFGTIGDSYRIARDLGHTTTRLAPGLTGIEFKSGYNLFGVRCPAKAQLLRQGKLLTQESGRVQFTDYGASGICIMNLSSYIDLGDKLKFSDYSLKLDFLDDLSREQVIEILTNKVQRTGGSVADALVTLINKDMIPMIMNGLDVIDAYEDHVKKHMEDAAEALESDDVTQAQAHKIEVVTDRLKGMEFKITGTQGWNVAQVTRGGIRMEEIDQSTGESKLIEDLYFAGEVLDYDGPCGGYNLQNAWLTALRVAQAIGEKFSAERA